MFQVDGESFPLEDPRQIAAVRSYLAKGEAETVAAALYKNIEPTEENLALVSKALNESPFDPELEEPSFPQDAIERLKAAVERSRAADRQTPAKENVKGEKLFLPQTEGTAPCPRPETAGSASASEEEMPPSADAHLHEAEESIQEREMERVEAAVGREPREAAADAQETAAQWGKDQEHAALSARESTPRSAVSDARLSTEFAQSSVRSDSSAALSVQMSSEQELAMAFAHLRETEAEPSESGPRAEVRSAVNAERRIERQQDGRILRASGGVGEQSRTEERPGFGSDRAIASEREEKIGATHGKGEVGATHSEKEIGASHSKEEIGAAHGKEETNAERSHRLWESEGAGDAQSVRGAAESDELGAADGAESWEAQLNAVLSQLLAGLENTNALLGVKQYEVTKLTDMTITAASEFRTFQNDVERILGRTTPASVKAAIDLLSRAINKSSFSLLADMRTEKTLLLALSKLDSAAEALGNKQFDAAERLVSEVAKEIGEIVFKPSVRRIHAIGEYDMRSSLRLLEKRPVTMGEKLSDALALFSETRGRDVLELLRFTGTNHEIEVFENTAAKSDIPNLKELFGDTSYASGMCGGQMLNDSGDGRKREFYVFDLPMKIDEEIEGLKVFVNGRSENNAIDWKNAELYFGLQARSGEKIGMKFSIRGGGLSVEVLADRPVDLSGLDEEAKALGYQMLSVRQFPYRKKDRLHLHAGSQELRDETDRADHRNGENEVRAGFDYKI